MKLQKLNGDFSVCKLNQAPNSVGGGFCFYARTDGEISLVCETGFVPPDALKCEHGYRALRVQGTLDFSLIGVLSELSSILAREKISVFAVSTYDTDYLFIMSSDFQRAIDALEQKGHIVSNS